MGINSESHFSTNPVSLDIGRSRFPRRMNHKFTANVSDIVPAYWTEILPGDTVKMDVSEVIRMSTPLDPVMDTLVTDIHAFFVPMRLVWDHTREFFGENTAGAWAPATTYTIPQLTFPTSGAPLQSVADYMGVPVGVTGISVSQLPFRAYAKIYEDWFIDQNTMAPPVWYRNDTTQTYANMPARGGMPYKAAKTHDYFTSCLPAPQRGSAVLIPFSGSGTVSISGTFPVTAGGSIHSMGNTILFAPGSASTGEKFIENNGTISGSPREIGLGSGLSGYSDITKSNLETAVSGSGSVSGISSTTSVNDLRMAFQMQKWYEKSALYGGRYIEMLKAQFGVTSPDARLQRSEYLGGRRVPINMTQVENNNGFSGSGSSPLGSLGAYSHTTDSGELFTHSFTEHGFLLITATTRILQHTYSQGIPRELSRKTMFEHYFPVFANLGNMPVLRKELYADGSVNDDDVFGFQEAWAEYRYSPDRVSGYMRPGVSGSLASWHYADYYTTGPTLSESWMKEDKTTVDRTLAVTSSAAPQLICDFLFDGTFVRAMPVYSIPGLIDHH